MTDTSTISEAVKVLSQRLKAKNADPQSESPIDIVGVVVGRSTKHSPPFSRTTSADIWISDSSLPSDVTARVSLFGMNEIEKVNENQIAVGDVIRFNRLSLGDSHTDKSYHFCHRNNNPDTGSKWLRLGQVNDGGEILTHRDGSRRISEEMVTADVRIKALVEWYQQKSRANGNAHAPLQPLPCQRRSLAEIQDSSGLMSNVVVRVTQYDQKNIVQPPTSRMLGRSAPSKQVVTGFASVTDGSGDMTLVDPGCRFGSILHTARDTGRILMLTHLLSKNQGEMYGRTVVVDEVVLTPSKSTVTIMLPEDYWKTHDQHMSNHHTSPETQTPDATPSSELCFDSNIIDIEINGTSLRKCGETNSSTDLMNTILALDGGYQSAAIKLGTCAVSCGDENGDESIYIGPNIVKVLCGGIDAEELKADKNLSLLCSRMVLALLREAVPLRWTIRFEVANQQPEVVKVGLPKL